MPADTAKRAAAEAAVALVEDGMRLGLGTGSTARWAVEALGRRIRDEGLRVVAIPTSRGTESLAIEHGIPLGSFVEIEVLDFAIDGADEVERTGLNLVKGGGGALLREKIVAQAARHFVVIADGSKLVERLGTLMPLPVEVVQFGHEATARRLAGAGGEPVLRMVGAQPFVTDGGNLVYDCPGFGPIADPWALDRSLSVIAGVIETGLFLGLADTAFIGEADGSVTTLKPGPS